MFRFKAVLCTAFFIFVINKAELKSLVSLNKYFWKYKKRLFFGIAFTVAANYFGVLSPQVARYIINKVKATVSSEPVSNSIEGYDPFFKKIIEQIDGLLFGNIVVWCGVVLVILALLKGFFTYLMRQTLIVMSRHIEFDQKNDIYKHYQTFDTTFMKQNSVGDLMNRISEDVSKVRMFTGPAIMYATNVIALITFCLWFMFQKSVLLTICTLAPLPILAFVIFKVNSIINKKSELQQQKLSLLTANAQESYSGIRVIKSFVQEKSIWNVFSKNSSDYSEAAISLAKTEAWYFPSISLLIGISTLITVMVGGLLYINGADINEGIIAEFIMYVSMLSFPFSSIGWIASIIQKASASQKRVNEFLDYHSEQNKGTVLLNEPIQSIQLKNVTFKYTDTNIVALNNIDLAFVKGESVAIVGRTGSGKTTLVQLLMRMMMTKSGTIEINGKNINDLNVQSLRAAISYIPQEAFLFSDTIENNLKFGANNASEAQLNEVTENAMVLNEINKFTQGYKTIVGERGVTLSGGQKQRITLARSLLKKSGLYVFDDCLSAVDMNTEINILSTWKQLFKNDILVFVTHRVSHLDHFDKIILLEDGKIVELGSHKSLLSLNGRFAQLFRKQQFEKID